MHPQLIWTDITCLTCLQLHYTIIGIYSDKIFAELIQVRHNMDCPPTKWP